MGRILISSRIFIPEKQVLRKDLKKHYSYLDFDDMQCRQCPVYKSGKRFSEEKCKPCDAYKGRVDLYKKKEFNGKTYYGIPVANPRRAEAKLGIDLSSAKDLRPSVPMKSNLKFVRKLRDGKPVDGKPTPDQVTLVKDTMKGLKQYKAGILQALPRFGKTVCAAYITCEFKQRTCILANKEKLLKQFKGTFEGDDKYINFTNAKDEEDRLGHPVVHIVKTVADFKRAENADIVLILYQKLIRSTSIQRVYDFILDKFGLVIVDEVHRGSATGFASLLARLNTKYRLGLSATPKNKKEERNLVLSETMGRVLAKSTSVNLAPRIEVFETGLQVGKPPRLWVYAIKHICKNKQRNIMIVKEAFKDLREGRKAVLIPVSYTDHMQELVDMINKQAEYNNRHKGENWPYPMAVPYCGAMPEKAKDSAMEKFDTGKAKVMVAISSMVVEGVDLAAPDMLYQIIPMSAKEGIGAPAFEQLTFRVATPAPGKTDPVVKVFIDGMPQSYWCFRSTYMFEIVPGLAKGAGKYRMNKYDHERSKQICDELRSNRSYVPKNMLGNRVSSKEIIKGYDPERRKAKLAQKTIKKDGLVKLRG